MGRIVAATKYGNAAMRWAGVGPYYAMFPFSFAQRVIRKYTKPGDIVLDPFAGRGTAVFAAAINERRGIGIEINPVGYVYTRTKLKPAREEQVAERIRALSETAWRYRKAASRLPDFYRSCYCETVREFLLTARNRLEWRETTTLIAQ